MTTPSAATAPRNSHWATRFGGRLWSPSRVKALLECAYRQKHSPFEESVHTQMGSLIHAFAEAWVNARYRDGGAEPDAAWLQAAMGSFGLLNWARDEELALALVEAFLTWEAIHPGEGKVLSVEGSASPYALNIAGQPKAMEVVRLAKTVGLRGIMDLVVEYRDRLRVLDYKTGKHVVDDPVAMDIYALMADRLYNPAQKPVEVLLAYVRSKRYKRLVYYPGADLVEAEQRTLTRARQAQAAEKKVARTPNKFCYNCAHKADCQPWQDLNRGTAVAALTTVPGGGITPETFPGAATQVAQVERLGRDLEKWLGVAKPALLAYLGQQAVPGYAVGEKVTSYTYDPVLVAKGLRALGYNQAELESCFRPHKGAAVEVAKALGLKTAQVNRVWDQAVVGTTKAPFLKTES